jgi:hypothetical protein
MDVVPFFGGASGMANGTFRIVTCDGGGIRGLLTTLLLQRLDQEFGILSRVDLFAGSSTGAIVALGLAAGVPIGELVHLYETEGPNIFSDYKETLGEVLRHLSSIPKAALGLLPGEFTHVRYGSEGLKSVLQQLFKSNLTLRELRPVLVTTFQLSDRARGKWGPLVLTNVGEPPTAAMPVLDAALAATAAPIYFPPHLVEQPPFGYCVDGGIFANNPATQAMIMALTGNRTPAQLRIFSVGTGRAPNCVPADRVPPPEQWGIFEWLCPIAQAPKPAMPLLHAIWEAFEEIDSYQCQQLLGDGFRRLNIPLPEPIHLNEYDKVGLMQEIVADYAASPAWVDLCSWIKEHFL